MSAHQYPRGAIVVPLLLVISSHNAPDYSSAHPNELSDQKNVSSA